MPPWRNTQIGFRRVAGRALRFQITPCQNQTIQRSVIAPDAVPWPQPSAQEVKNF